MPQILKINGVNCEVEYLNIKTDNVRAGYKVGSSVKELAQAHKADVAIDFNFADNTTGTPIGRLIVDGKEVNSDIPKTAPRDEFYMHDGKFIIGKAPTGADWAVQGSPRLLRDGKDVIDETIKRDQTGTDIWKSNAKRLRTAVGIINAHKAVAVRTYDAITLYVLRDIMRSLGCIDALNGDGGGSAYMYPADNGWGRKMGSALLIDKEVFGVLGTLNTKKDFIPTGSKNRPGDKRQPLYVTVHDTANKSKGADAEAHAKYLKGSAVDVPASWHWTVDDKLGIQHLPHDESAYHAGDGRKGTGNALSIGVEICEHSDGDRAKAEANAAILIAHILKETGLSIDAVVQHNKWSGKNCPASFRSGNGWSNFINKVKGEFSKITETKPVETAKTDASIIEAKVIVNGIELSVKGEVKDGVTRVPVRAVAEALGATVAWDAKTNTVTITK